jgi:hypothetical protein
MDWLQKHYSPASNPSPSSSTADEAVVYFGDDDNTYDIRIFEEVGAYVYLPTYVLQNLTMPVLYY